MLHPENLGREGRAAFDEVEEAPWFQAHHAELGSTSGRAPARATRLPRPGSSQGGEVRYLDQERSVRPMPRVA